MTQRIDIKYPGMNNNFIKLNQTDETPIWVNKLMIVTMQNSELGTYLTTFNKRAFIVKETPDEILKMIG